MSRTLRRWPTLYKKSTSGSGKISQWTVWLEGATVHTEAGYVGGKMKYSSDTIKAGKNLGRVNATTPESQAEAEAASQYNKYIDKLYTREPSGISKGKKPYLLPMLAQSFDKHSKKISWPAYAQPKYNGGRCIATNGPEGTTLTSRTGEVFSKLPTLQKQVSALFKALSRSPKLAGIALDGELYSPEYADNLEKTMSTIRKANTVSADEAKIQYYIYDLIPKHPISFAERLKILNDIALLDSFSNIVFVPTTLISNLAELKAVHRMNLKAGYEGTMIRNTAGPYEIDRRSYHLQKYKPYHESEFRIVGITGEGSGKLQGAIKSFVLEIDDEHGKRNFDCKLAGTGITEFLKKAYKDPTLWRGKWMRVQFFSYTKANRVPAQPRGIELRDIE